MATSPSCGQAVDFTIRAGIVLVYDQGFGSGTDFVPNRTTVQSNSTASKAVVDLSKGLSIVDDDFGSPRVPTLLIVS